MTASLRATQYSHWTLSLKILIRSNPTPHPDCLRRQALSSATVPTPGRPLWSQPVPSFFQVQASWSLFWSDIFLFSYFFIFFGQLDALVPWVRRPDRNLRFVVFLILLFGCLRNANTILSHPTGNGRNYGDAQCQQARGGRYPACHS